MIAIFKQASWRTLVTALALLLASACSDSQHEHLRYDPSANPAAALEVAKQEAVRSGRRVLIIAGGDWCRWCHVLDSFLAENGDVQTAIDRSFVTIKVYTGDDNPNDAFFENLPEAEGYPHFWVVDGNLVRSIETGPLESGDNGYDKVRFLQMLHRNAKP